MPQSNHYAVQAIQRQAADEIRKIVMQQFAQLSDQLPLLLLANNDLYLTRNHGRCYGATFERAIVVRQTDPRRPIILTPKGLFITELVSSVEMSDYNLRGDKSQLELNPLIIELPEDDTIQLWLRWGDLASRLLDDQLVGISV